MGHRLAAGHGDGLDFSLHRYFLRNGMESRFTDIECPGRSK